MSNTLNLGNGNWATKEDALLGYNSESNNYKPLPFDFERGSVATRINKEGLIETVGANEPRVDYKDDSKGALLLEPSRTNLIPYSEDFSQWISIDGVVRTDNFTNSPDGSQNASKLVFNGTPNSRIEVQVSSSGTNTQSVYLKTESGTQNVSIGSSSTDLTEFTITDQWVRYTHTGGGSYPRILCSDAATIYAWGCQYEAGSYATSYIPTQNTAQTRLADECNNGANDQVINSTEGTLYVEANLIDGYDNNNWLGIIYDNSNANNRVYIQRYLGNIQGGIRVNGVIQSEITQSNSSLGKNKIAFTFKQNEFKLFVNGSQVSSTDTIGSVFSENTLDTLNVGVYHNNTLQFNSGIDDVKLYNTALTDQELIALTQV